MPAWITSELRELVCVPMASSPSRMTTSRPARASARATASPTTPAPITTASTLSMEEQPVGDECADARETRGGGHRARRAVEEEAERGADQGAGAEADRADERSGRPGRLRERRQRRGDRVRHDHRGTEKKQHERQYHRQPVAEPQPGEQRATGAC